MSLTKKKKEVLSLIDKMDETRLDALLLLLREPLGTYELSEEEWAETDRRRSEAKKDKTKLIPARDAIRQIEMRLKKRK